MDISEKITTIGSLMSGQPELTELILIMICGLIAFALKIIIMQIIRRTTDFHSSRYYRSIANSGTQALWFLSLVFLDYFVSHSPEQKINLILIVQSLIAINLVIRHIISLIKVTALARLLQFTLIPLILLNAFQLLIPISEALAAYAINVGNLHISLFDVLRISYFGILLFWLGKESNRIGKQQIRQQVQLDLSTREIIAKLFEVLVYIVIFLILLNLLGINPTTLAVLGGAIGVGIGFGLQSIASNFLSGIIILLDRSLSIGDYIELEDGRAGIIRELNLRAVTLETFDGKDIVVPNDIFFSQSFTNWTHKNRKQRYSIEFDVAYSTDLDRLFPLVKAMLREHEQVLSGEEFPIEEQPDIEISGFGDNGIRILIEFWINAIDDGENRVGGDLHYTLWKLMKNEGFEFPFPQRDVRILNPVDSNN